MKIFIVIPVFNEEKVIESVIEEIKNSGYQNIIAVDDGSSDETFKKINSLENVVALKHGINRGKGATVKTGIEAAKMLGADVVVTLDGDGQHNPSEIKDLTRAITEEGNDVALGTRLKERKKMPFLRKIYNNIGNFITWYLFGIWVNDSQSGFRAYSSYAVEKIDTQGDRYEYESEVIKEIAHHKLSFKEVPIQVRYTDYSKNKAHQQGLTNGFKTVYKLILNIIK